MLTTEADAKNKRCQEGYAASFSEEMTGPIFCRGSDCMAWRWRHEPRPDRDGQGYCGKAGPA